MQTHKESKMNMDNMREYLNKIISLEQEQPVEEGTVKDMIQDVEEGMGKEEFEKKYPGQNYDEIRKEIEDRMNEETVEESDIDQIAEVGKVYPKIKKMKMELVDGGMEPEEAHEKACEKYGVDPAMCDKYIEMQRDAKEGTVEEGAMKELLHDLAGKRDLEDFVNDAGDYGMTDEEATEFWKSVNEDVNEDDAMVSVPVQELADILQLAGYENYADKIEEYANEPEEEYSDTEDQLIGLSGGLNRPKKQYPASAPGDNPMDQEPREIEESVEDKLYKSYKDFLEAEEIKSND